MTYTYQMLHMYRQQLQLGLGHVLSCTLGRRHVCADRAVPITIPQPCISSSTM